MDILMMSKLDVQLSDTHGDESKNKVEEMKEEEPKVDDESKPALRFWMQRVRRHGHGQG